MIEAVNIHKSYGALKVLSDVSLKVGNGEGLAVIGKNGSGKTTLLRILGALAKPDSGTVIIDGVNIVEVNEDVLSQVRRNIGFSFQQPLLLPYLSILENVTLPLVNNTKKEKAATILKKLGLSERIKHKPNELSEGEKKRVDFCRAIVKDPKILIADEPFANLDTDSASRISELMEEFISKKGVLIISLTKETHLTFIDEIVRLS